MKLCKIHGTWMTPVACEGGYTVHECAECKAELKAAVGMKYPRINLAARKEE